MWIFGGQYMQKVGKPAGKLSFKFCVNTYYALEKGEAEYYEKVAIDTERREKGE